MGTRWRHHPQQKLVRPEAVDWVQEGPQVCELSDPESGQEEVGSWGSQGCNSGASKTTQSREGYV